METLYIPQKNIPIEHSHSRLFRCFKPFHQRTCEDNPTITRNMTFPYSINRNLYLASLKICYFQESCHIKTDGPQWRAHWQKFESQISIPPKIISSNNRTRIDRKVLCF